MTSSTASQVSRDTLHDAAPSDPAVGAMRHPFSHARLWIAAVAGLVADLWTKHWAFETVGWGKSDSIVDGILSFHLSLNPGALFGLGAGFAPIFVGASVLALMFVLYLFANSSARQRSLHVALGLVLAGALGNLYDRATQEACVVHLADARGRTARDIGSVVSDRAGVLTLADYRTGEQNLRTWTQPNPDGPKDRFVISDYGPEPVVRDFIKFEVAIGGRTLYPWIFNIADALLVVGVGVLLLNFWSERKHAPAAEA